MDCTKLTYNHYGKPAMRCVYNVVGRQEGYTFERKSLRQLKKMGNITFKTDAGNFLYGNSARPYQITEQTNIPATYDDDPLTATYTSGERPLTINKSGNTATFLYNHAGQRTKMTVSGATANYTRVYLGSDYEHEKIGNTTTERLYLGGTPYNAPAVAIRTDGGAWQLHYIHRDYLGSIVAVSNTAGASVETRSYDAWGRLRNPTTLQPLANNDSQASLLLRRGFTGHEHLPEFGLINMNARLYDPAMGRFISPDPYVQNPFFSQNYNRYTYCLNNPLKYIDPSGKVQYDDYYFTDDPEEIARFLAHLKKMEEERALFNDQGSGGGSLNYDFSSWTHIYYNHDTGWAYSSYSYSLNDGADNRLSTTVVVGVSVYVGFPNYSPQPKNSGINVNPQNDLRSNGNNNFPMGGNPYIGIDWGNPKMDGGGATKKNPISNDFVNGSGLTGTIVGGAASMTATELFIENSRILTNSTKYMKLGGNVLGGVGFGLTGANAIIKGINGNFNTSDTVDLGISGGLLVVGIIFPPAGVGLGIAYGAIRLGWGDKWDNFLNENFGLY